MLEKQIVVRCVPIALWQQLKIKAAVKGITLQQIVVEAFTQYLKAA